MFGDVMMAMVVFLGDTSFLVRETAHGILERTGIVAAPVLTLALAHPDPEVSHRAGRILAGVRAAQVSRWLAGLAAIPYIDAHPDSQNQSALTAQYLEGAKGAGHPVRVELPGGGTDWPAYREATRLWVTDRIAAGEPWAKLAPVLAVMVERTLHYDRTGRFPP